jgi:ABC-2 type transport system permease protein
VDPSQELVASGIRAIRRAACWWGVGVLVMALVSVGFWPSLEDSEALASFDEMGDLLAAFGAQNIGTAAGYLDGQLFSMMLPLLLSGLSIATTTAVTSGDEDAGRLEFLHALPVARRAVWLFRFAASAIAVAAVSLATVLLVLALRAPLSYTEASWSRIVWATAGAAALALLHSSVAFAAGAAGRGRGAAVGLAVAVLVIGYTAALLAPLVEALAWMRRLSPWYWALQEQPVTNGSATPWWLLLAGVTIALVCFGAYAIDHRDIRSA